jgi:MFS family permease
MYQADQAVISFYSSTIFENVGYSATQALYASLGYGAIQVVFTIPTLFMIDTVGRRRLCLIVSQAATDDLKLGWFFRLSLSCASSCSRPACLYWKPTEVRPQKSALSSCEWTNRFNAVIDWHVRFVYLFTIMYSLGEGPVAFQYSAEVFPTIQREQGMAWAVFINNFFGK